jgi:hypothetical protein
MSQRAARDEQNRLAGNAMHDPGTGLTTALYHDLPADIGQGFHTVGDVIYEGGVAAMQHGIEDLAGLPPDTAEQPGLTTTEAIRTYPPAVQAGIRGAEGFVRTLPQMGIAAVNPYAGAISFGFTPEGFSAKNAAIAAALPFIGSKAGAVVENIAARAGVSGDVALQAFQKIGGAAGAAGLIGADEAYHISQLPEEEQRQAWIDATGNIGSMFLLGTMGHSERLKNTDKVLADRASANAETMRGIERDFNRRNAGPAEEGASVPTWEGTEANSKLQIQNVKSEQPSSNPRIQQSEPRPTEMEYAGGEIPRDNSKFEIQNVKSPAQTITGSNVRTGTEMPVQPQPASVGGRAPTPETVIPPPRQYVARSGQKVNVPAGSTVTMDFRTSPKPAVPGLEKFIAAHAKAKAKMDAAEVKANATAAEWDAARDDGSPERTAAAGKADGEAQVDLTKAKAAFSAADGELALERHRVGWSHQYGQPDPVSDPKITPKVLKAQKEYLMDHLAQAIKDAPEDGTGKITISVPGDGEFTLSNTKASLKKFKDEGAKQFPTTVGKAGPGLPAVNAKAAAKVSDAKPDDLGKIAGEFVSDEPARVGIQTAYADGTQIIATDGRQLLRIVTDKALGKPGEPVRIDAKGKVKAKNDDHGNYPNWKAVIPNNPDLLVGGVDTAKLHHIARQAEVFRNTSVEDASQRGNYPMELWVNPDRSLGGRMEIQVDINKKASTETFEHNLQANAKRLGNYNPDYILNAANAARRLGSETVDFLADSNGPLVIRGKTHESVVSPFRMNKGSDVVRDTIPPALSGQKTHARLPEGFGPLKDPDLTITRQPDIGATGDVKVELTAGKLEVFQGKLESNYRGQKEMRWKSVGELIGDQWPASKGQQDATSKQLIKEAIFHNVDVRGSVAEKLSDSINSALSERKEILDEIASRKGKPARGTSAVGDPMMPPIPPGVPSGVHSSGRMPVAMERIVPGQVDIPTIMDAMENVVRAVGAESPIRTGRFYAQARGIFKTFDKVIRLRAADNIPTAAHEVAHAVSDAVFGSSGSAALMRAMKPSPLYKQAVAELRALGRALYGNTKPAAGYTAEGFSELTRLWLTTENAAKTAPHATKWLESELFKAQPDLHGAMKNARDLVDVWRGQGAEGRASAQSKGQDTRFEQLKKIAKEYLGKQAQVEEFAPLEELSRGYERITGKRLEPRNDPFMLATANRGVAGHILENFVERGVQDIWGNRTGPSLKEAFARLKPVDAENFRNYLWSRRALERWGKNKNPGMTLEDATYLKNKLETPAFIDAASKWYQWWDGVLEYVKAASPATNGPMIDAIRAGSSDYVPLARVLPETAQRAAQARLGGGMMKMHGSGLPVREIYLQSLLTAERLISRAHKDMVLDSVFKLAQTEGMGWLVERVPRTKVMEGLNIEKIRQELEGMGVDTTAISPDTLLKYASHLDRPTGSDPIMVRMVNGKPEWYQVPAGLFELLQGVDAPRLGKVADLFLGVPNRAFKMGTTGLRASFSLVTNPLRDLPTFMHQSLAGNPASRLGEYVGALKDIVQAGLTGKESANWQTFKQLGIGGGTFLGGDIRQAQREVKGLFRGKVFRRLASPVETLREALSFTESAPRLAEMNLVGKESGWKPGARLTPDQAIAMKVAAKRVTTDFSAGGRVGKMVNQAVPFYNAVIQGTRSFGRAFQKEQGFKTKDHAAAKATLTGLALLTLPTIYNWWRNKDEDWYRNLPWRERYLYTNVDAGDGTIVQVPRPAEWGNVFQVVPEILLDSWYQRDPVYLKEGLKHIFATQNPLDYPVLLKLAKEQWSNRIDFFDKPIVPRGELDLPPGQQRAYFSSILAKSLGDAFPNTLSPRRVDAAVRGIFGGVGSDLADAPGAVMRMMGIKDSGVRESEPADIPVMGRLFRRGGEFSANGRYLADFWDSYMQHQARLKGNTHALKAGGQPTATSKELLSARTLTAYHAAIKLQMEMAARATEQEDRRRLYKQATETARRALEATK